MQGLGAARQLPLVLALTYLAFSTQAHNLTPELEKRLQDVADGAARHFSPQGFSLAPPAPELRTLASRIALRPRDDRGTVRPLVLAAMSGAASFKDVTPLFLESLQGHKFTLLDGTPSDLAKHMLLYPVTAAAHALCQEQAAKYGHTCYFPERTPGRAGGAASAGPSEGHAFLESSAYFLLGFQRIHTVADILTLGYDVAFIDTDIVVLRNPVPYLLRLHGDVYGLHERCMAEGDTDGMPEYPFGLGPNLGLLYIRSTPSTMKVIMDWAFTMTYHVGTEMQPDPWDQFQFGRAVQSAARGFLGSHLLVGRLDAERFTGLCHGWCGCNLRFMKREMVHAMVLRPTNCTAEEMRPWYLYHAACHANHADGGKLRHLQRVMADYTALVGPLGSLSDPMPW